VEEGQYSSKVSARALSAFNAETCQCGWWVRVEGYYYLKFRFPNRGAEIYLLIECFFTWLLNQSLLVSEIVNLPEKVVTGRIGSLALVLTNSPKN